MILGRHRQGSNPQLSDYKTDALPIELLCHCGSERTRTYELVRGRIYSPLQLPLCDTPNMSLRKKRADKRISASIGSQALYNVLWQTLFVKTNVFYRNPNLFPAPFAPHVNVSSSPHIFIFEQQRLFPPHLCASWAKYFSLHLLSHYRFCE